ncbi:hypothetical protein [Roseobacter weihaiensis]|uniref:hypothetical protein n=1 Tax=Roseobacter weihaiensis TaxID=2763262 RepID=UPI001D0B2488|nr:hypothetical protein [Roseobacter sp. H9]
MSDKEEFAGIYTAYMAGVAGQGLAMFVFRDGVIAGADVTGVVFSGKYAVEGEKLIGTVEYKMPADSISITGAEFDLRSKPIVVPLELPISFSDNETYKIDTPIGPVNARFVKNTGFD